MNIVDIKNRFNKSKLIKFVVTKIKLMDGDESNKQENTGDSLPNDSDFPESVRIRHISLQINTINQRLLVFNGRTIFIGGLILWAILPFI
jgi:hypothetical protein